MGADLLYPLARHRGMFLHGTQCFAFGKKTLDACLRRHDVLIESEFISTFKPPDFIFVYIVARIIPHS